jgi:hypothetical protein
MEADNETTWMVGLMYADKMTGVWVSLLDGAGKTWTKMTALKEVV